jgi:small Trp-rich protein
MILVWGGLVLVLLKWFELGPVALLSWWWVLAPFGLALLWFEVAETLLGRDRRHLARNEWEERRKQRIQERFADRGPRRGSGR